MNHTNKTKIATLSRYKKAVRIPNKAKHASKPARRASNTPTPSTAA